MKLGGTLHAQPTEAYDKNRSGAADQAWHRAKAQRRKRNMLKSMQNLTAAQLAQAETRIKEEQKAAWNAGSICKKKHGRSLSGGVLTTPRA